MVAYCGTGPGVRDTSESSCLQHARAGNPGFWKGACSADAGETCVFGEALCEGEKGECSQLCTLSVSTSAMLSPADTSSPSFFFHSAMFPVNAAQNHQLWPHPGILDNHSFGPAREVEACLLRTTTGMCPGVTGSNTGVLTNTAHARHVVFTSAQAWADNTSSWYYHLVTLWGTGLAGP